MKKYSLLLLIFTIIAGPLGIIPLGYNQINVYLTDIAAVTFILSRIKIINKRLFKNTIAVPLGMFIAVCAISLIITPVKMSVLEYLISSMYLIRFVMYGTIFLLLFSSEKLINVRKTLILSGLLLALLGWIQYFLYPDLRNLYYLGFDPHYARIFGTYLDPNFFGIMIVLTIILLLYLIEKKQDKKFKIFIYSLIIFSILTLLFTYSRSSYLAFIAAVSYFAIQKKRYILLAIIIFFLGVLPLLPRPQGAGVMLERVFSIKERLTNWQEAGNLFLKHPILGIGFNALRYAKQQYHLPEADLTTSHAGAGYDNSLLFVAATTGIIGLAAFILLGYRLWIAGDVVFRTSLLAVIIHSFFINSLFFEWVMLWLWLLLSGKKFKGDNSL